MEQFSSWHISSQFCAITLQSVTARLIESSKRLSFVREDKLPDPPVAAACILSYYRKSSRIFKTAAKQERFKEKLCHDYLKMSNHHPCHDLHILHIFCQSSARPPAFDQGGCFGAGFCCRLLASTRSTQWSPRSGFHHSERYEDFHLTFNSDNHFFLVNDY